MSNQQQDPQRINISEEQMTGAIQAGITFFGLETTLIPGNLRKQLTVLEMLFSGLAQGALVIASPDRLAVESTPEDKGSPAVRDAVISA